MDSNLYSPYTGQIDDDSVNLGGSQIPDITLEILAGDLGFLGEDWRSLSWIERVSSHGACGTVIQTRYRL